MLVCEAERALLPSETLFDYHGGERYLSMQEYFKVSSNEQYLQSHAILDEQLSTILKRTKELIRLPTAPPYDEETPLITKVQDHEPPLLFRKAYLKYCELADYVFGRSGWGRSINCLRVSSDLISRLHARLSVNLLTARTQTQQLLKDVSEAILLTYYSSPFRKLSRELWKKIMEYAQERTRYVIRDCGSRNGTFLMDCSLQRVLMHEGEGYQLQGRDYVIYATQMLQASGKCLAEKIKTFQEHWKSQEFYHPRYTYKIIYPPTLQTPLHALDHTLHAIHFYAEFTQELKYYFWVISAADDASFGIGEGQAIAVSPSPEQPTYETGRHGTLQLRGGVWILKHSYSEQHLWVKLPAEKDYELSPSRRYRIRLGHVHMVEVCFHNFT